MEQRKAQLPGAIAIEVPSRKLEGEPLRIVSVLAGGPADKAGVRANDAIVEVDGKSVPPLTLDGALALLRGPPGSFAHLRIVRRGEPTLLSFSATREEIRVQYVRSKLLPGNIAYLRISFFGRNSADQVAQQLLSLRRSAPKPPVAVVLDLRNSPGGSLEELVKVASFFYKSGTHFLNSTTKGTVSPIYSLDWIEGDGKLSDAKWSSIGSDIPFVVVVNRGTGSGSEAFAQSLREQFNATIIGEGTAGYGFLQRQFVLDGAAAVTLSIAQLSSAGGTSWHGNGLRIDVRVPELDVSRYEYGALPEDETVVAALQLLSARLTDRER